MTRRLDLLFFLLMTFTAGAAGSGADHGVASEARTLFPEQGLLAVATNSLFAAAIVTGVILWFCRSAMKNASVIPGDKQNFVELVVEFLYKQVETILGPVVAPRAFPLLATIFVFVTVANWAGLFPGVGTIGFNDHQEGWAATHFDRPLLRPATADMNMTVGIALISLVVWFYLTMREIGFMGFIQHTFGPKGGLVGVLKWCLIPIFLVVGVIEIVSILFRPLTLSLRLYGNIFAGENLLHTMGSLVQTKIPWIDWICSVLMQLPFYFLEILVGVLQGMVFALLNAVFIKLSTTHDEGHEAAHH